MMKIFKGFKKKKIEVYFKHGSKDVTSGIVEGTDEGWLLLGRGDNRVTYVPIDNIARFEEVIEFGS